MNLVPLQALESQTVSIILNGQSCRINVYQKSTGMYADVYLNDSKLLTCVSCLDRDRIVRDKYLGFVGDLAFIDTQGSNDPTYDGIGSRYYLMYFAPGDMAT